MNGFDSIVEVAAGLITVAGGVYAAVRWLLNTTSDRKPSNVFEKDGNIYFLYPKGDSKQITFLGADWAPVLAKSKVIFFRGEQITQAPRPYTRYKLISIDTRTLKETLVSDQKPFADGQDNSFELLNPGYLSLSTNQAEVVFTIEKFVTALQLVSVNLKTGKWTELFSVEHFEIIKSGKYKNKLLVGMSEVRDRGREIYYKVCDHQGKVLLEFADYDAYMTFRATAMTRE